MKGLIDKAKNTIQLYLEAKEKKCKIFSWKHVNHLKINGNNIIYSQCQIYDVELGKYSYIGGKSKITKCKIGNYVSIGEGLRIIAGVHPTTMVSTHPIFYSTTNEIDSSFVHQQKFNEYKYSDDDGKWFVEIGNDVWIGENVSILSGVKIGHGAIVGTGAVVTKDVPPYAIVVGIPAKLIKYRFDDNTISKLLECSWWDRDEKWIRENAELFSEVPLFLEKVNGKVE